jgi:hypothetical protein
LANPFASLFGKSAPTTAASIPSRPSTPPIPTSTLSAAASDVAEHAAEILASTITSRIVFGDVCSAINDNLLQSVTIEFPSTPTWALEKFMAFAAPLFPFVPINKVERSMFGAGKSSTEWRINDASQDSLDDVAERFQEFYRIVEIELHDRLQSSERNPASVGAEGGKNEVLEKLASHDDSEIDQTIREVLESVESALCSLFYDRYFLPSSVHVLFAVLKRTVQIVLPADDRRCLP